MKVETKKLADGRYSLFLEGEWFDDFHDIENLLNAIGNCMLLAENPMTADFINGMIRAKVIREAPPKE